MSDHATREDAIVAAALDLAEVAGVNGITTAALARRLEFTEAALYRYFPSKGAIIAASLRHLGNRLFATMMLELMPEAVGPGHAASQQLQRHAERFTFKGGLLVELLLAAAAGHDDELQATGHAFLQSYRERLAEYFRQLKERALIGADASAAELARLWLCQLIGGFVTARLAGEPWDPLRHPGLVTFVAGLHAAPAGAAV